MQSAVIDKVKSRISHSKFGEVFFVSSFPEYDVEYVTKLLSILEKEEQSLAYPKECMSRLARPALAPSTRLLLS